MLQYASSGETNQNLFSIASAHWFGWIAYRITGNYSSHFLFRSVSHTPFLVTFHCVVVIPIPFFSLLFGPHKKSLNREMRLEPVDWHEIQIKFCIPFNEMPIQSNHTTHIQPTIYTDPQTHRQCTEKRWRARHAQTHTYSYTHYRGSTHEISK